MIATLKTKLPSPVGVLKSCIIVYNPVSTHFEQGKHYIEELQSLFPGACTTLQTSPKSRQANQEILLKHIDELGDHTLLGIIGGDGTVNTFIDALVNDKRLTEEMRHTTVLPLWGGNANDLAHMLNGTPRHSSLPRLLSEGHAVAIHPLVCEFIEASGNTKIRMATCYASFGASAFAAQWLETSRHKKIPLHILPGVKFIYELALVSNALIKASRFTINDNTGTRDIYEQIFINGSRFAKVAGIPLKITDKTFYRTVVENKRLSALTFHIVRLTQKRPVERVGEGKQVSFTIREGTWAQFDGEVLYLPAHTEVKIHLSTKPFYALSTVLS